VLPAVCFLSVSCSAQKPGAATVAASKEEKALGFTLKDLHGNDVSLNDFSGKAVFLEFTTTWCPYCITMIPEIKKAYNDYKDKGLEVVAVYIRERKEDVEAFDKEHGIPYRVLLDPDGSIATQYRVVGVPTIIIIDKDGVIRYKGHKVPSGIIEDVVKEVR